MKSRNGTPGLIQNYAVRAASRWPNSRLWTVLKVYLPYRLLASLAGYAVWALKLDQLRFAQVLPNYRNLPPVRAGLEGALVGVWQRWDALVYQDVAQSGYSSWELNAFFPLYPFSARIPFVIFGGPALLWLLLISNAALILSLMAVHRVAEWKFGEKTAQRAIAGMILLPGFVFLIAPYPMSLALLFILLAAEATTRDQWRAATLWGFLAGVTHLSTLPLAILLGIEGLQQIIQSKNLRGVRYLIPACGPVLGSGAILLRQQFIDTPGFSEILNSIWTTRLVWPWENFLRLPQFAATLDFALHGWVDVGLAAGSIILLALSWRRIPHSWWAYSATLLLLSLSMAHEFEAFVSQIRYSLLNFPLLIYLADRLDNPVRKIVVFSAASFVQLFLLVQFLLWIYIG